jgi:hypothetical protein
MQMKDLDTLFYLILNPRYATGLTLFKQKSSYLLQFTQFWQYAGSPQSDLLSSVMGCIQVHNCQVNIAQVASVNVLRY